MKQRKIERALKIICQSLNKNSSTLLEYEGKTPLEIDKEWGAICDRYRYKYHQLKTQFQFEKDQFFKKYGRY
jgi:hypothetical protein